MSPVPPRTRIFNFLEAFSTVDGPVEARAVTPRLAAPPAMMDNWTKSLREVVMEAPFHRIRGGVYGSTEFGIRNSEIQPRLCTIGGAEENSKLKTQN
jgi:hypothetical protein